MSAKSSVILAITVILGCLALTFSSHSPTLAQGPDKNDIPILNKAVLKFTMDNIDKQVGGGECWDLIDQALAAAKAKRPDPKIPWVFGKEVKLDELIPGDILVEHYPGGKHVAIVDKVAGNKMDLLHQNVNGVRKVVRWANWNLDRIKKSEVHFYRPISQ